jgi:SAM-dependent methyltransferase
MSLANWLNTPLGRRCLANEQRVVRQALDRVFGEQLLQIGAWGARDTFLRHARTQRAALVDWNRSDWPRESTDADFVCQPGQLAVASDTVDAVFLPHTLERAPSAHALLRESSRVLRADGHLVVLGFAPGGLWGLRQLLSRDGYPPGGRRMIREGRVKDWLELLSFDVASAQGYCHALPFERVRRFATFPRESWASRWMPFTAAGYLLVAQKRTLRLTPIRPAWRRARLRAVGGLVEPTTRASRTRES